MARRVQLPPIVVVREASIGPSSWNGASYEEVVDLLEDRLSSERTIRMPAAVPSAPAMPIAPLAARRAPAVTVARPAPAKRSSRGPAVALFVGLAVVAAGLGFDPSLRRVTVEHVQHARVRASAWIAPIAARAAARVAPKRVETANASAAPAPPPPVVEEPAPLPETVTVPSVEREPTAGAAASETKKPRARRASAPAEIDPASLLDDGLATAPPPPKGPSIDPASLLDRGLAPP